MAAPTPGITPAVVLVGSLWTLLNILLSLWNKWMFVTMDFHFPIYIIMTGLFVTFLGSAVAIFGLGIGKMPPAALLRSEWLLLLAASCSHGLATGLENVSIESISISLNQVIKATAPALTMTCSSLFEGKVYRKRVVAITAMLVFGAVLTTLHNPSFALFGFLASVASMLLGVMRVMINSRQLHRLDIDAIALTLLTSLPGSLSLLVPFLWWELDGFLLFLQRDDAALCLVLVFAMNLVALLYIFVGMLLIKLTSAHYSQVIASLKVVLLVISSTVIFHVSFTTLNHVGLVISFLAFCWYSYFRAVGMEEKPQAEQDHRDDERQDGRQRVALGDDWPVVEVELEAM